MNFTLQANNNSQGLPQPTNTTSAISNIGLNLCLLIALYLLLPFQMNASTVVTTTKEATTEMAATNKRLTIKNDGTCEVQVFHWLTSGDVYHTNLKAGNSWSVDTERGQTWRVINTNHDWRNLSYDEHYVVNNNSTQTFTITPSYCGAATNCGTVALEHFSAIAESACGANDGKILHDPFINQGTKLPYYIEYTYNRSTKREGPYAENKDNFINNLAPGTYQNLTLIDANGCSNDHGDVTVEAATCQTAIAAPCQATLEHFSAIAETACGANDGKILHDPHLNAGTKLPYYIEYTYNGTTERQGPYAENKDNFINN